MRLTRILLKNASRPVRSPKSRLEAPIPVDRKAKDFDALFPQTVKPAKAWEGQDKDAYFRDKFAHVHAKQLKRRKEEKERAKLATKATDNQSRKEEHRPSLPRPDFAEQLKKKLLKDRRIEYIYGTSAVKAVLRKRTVSAVYSGYSLADVDPQILKLCGENDVKLEADVPMQHLNIMSDNGVHNKYVAATRKRTLQQVTAIPAVKGRLFLGDSEIDSARAYPVGLYIDQITDTHNMGAILRSASWFGVDFVAYSSRNCAPFSPAVVKASVGASEYLNIVETPHPLRLFENLKEQGWAIVSTLPNPSNMVEMIAAKELAQLAQSKPTIIVVGSEGDGIRTNLVQRSTHGLSIEKFGGKKSETIDSLNVSVASALILSNLSK